jgi:hypothetical protein
MMDDGTVGKHNCRATAPKMPGFEEEMMEKPGNGEVLTMSEHRGYFHSATFLDNFFQ